MEDHNPHYGVPELRQLMKVGGTTTRESPSTSSHHFPSDFFGFNLAPPPPPPPPQPQFTTDQELGFLQRGVLGLVGVSSNTNLNVSRFLDGGGFGNGGDGGGGNGRWPRQETLTLLEIRSSLDHKFKEANQKGPLWDEVSRIMSEEHGYHQRSGKKCREKFENLYKYYRKTKEGKAGRQDGKHYRFFRQLEALYGDSSNLVSCPNHNTQFMMSNALHQKSLSLLSNNYNNSSEMSSSSERNDSRSNWKAKIKEFIDINMRRLIERQDFWLEKLTKVIEDKEEERMMKEEEWRKIEADRIEFWTKERERMEARDVAVIETLKQLMNQNNGSDQTMTNWNEEEIVKLMEIRMSMDSAFEEILGECSDEFLWEEIATKMIQLGFDQRSALVCKEKWELMIRKDDHKKQINKKRKDLYYPRTQEPIYNNQESGYKENDDHHDHQMNEQGNVGSSTSNANANAGNPSGAMAASTNCFPFFIGDGDQNLWESYGLRLSKGNNQ